MTIEQWQRYAAIWSLPQAERDRELEDCVEPEVSYADPNVAVSGLRAFSDYMAGFQRGFPGNAFRVQVDASGAVVGPGLSFAETGEDGRFRRIRGFFGQVDELLR